LVESRLEFCRSRYGVPHTILSRGDGAELDEAKRITGGDRYAVVVDATGNNKSMANALGFVAHTGTLVYVGITSDAIAIPHPALHRPEMTIKGSRNALPKDFRRIIGLIEDGTIDTAPWITHRTPFDEMIDRFESYTRPETGVIKAMVEVS
ncbi:MAG TPA: zinc-binding dehydrogenase, partial [Planctomycetaceae bacterium]